MCVCVCVCVCVCMCVHVCVCACVCAECEQQSHYYNPITSILLDDYIFDNNACVRLLKHVHLDGFVTLFAFKNVPSQTFFKNLT